MGVNTQDGDFEDVFPLPPPDPDKNAYNRGKHFVADDEWEWKVDNLEDEGKRD